MSTVFLRNGRAAKPRHFAEQNAGEPQQGISGAFGARRFGGVREGRAERKPRRLPMGGGAFCGAKCGVPPRGSRIEKALSGRSAGVLGSTQIKRKGPPEQSFLFYNSFFPL